mgnify:FL=1
MSDIHKRDYGRELEKKKSRRTQKHRASQRQLTAKFKKELVGKKRQEQTAESRAAEQAEQSAELLTQECAAQLTSGAVSLSHEKENRTGNERVFSDNDPSIHPSDQTTAPDETVPWNAKKPAGAWRQQAKEEMSKKIRAEYSGSGLVSTGNGQRAEHRARSRSARASAKPASSQSSRQAAASERGRRLAMQRKRQERATTLIQRTGAKILDWLRRGAAVSIAGTKALTLRFLTAGGAVTAFVLFGGIVLVAALMASPFGILFANEPSPDTIPLNAAVAEVGKEVCSTLAELQDGNYDSVDLTGVLPDWREVIAVFAARTAGAENGVDVATMDADRVDRLKTVFWDMTEITSEVDTIYHDGGENGEDWTEHILHLAVAAKSAEEMSTDYRFTAYQKKALAELLDDPALLDALLHDLDSLQYDAAMLRRALPRNLSKERRAVVERALSLAGKVNYFWGGKSLVFGWDDRWGQLAKVTADGSSTTGTYRPYGLDCSGMVDWAFYNATDGSYVIGHGGGAAMQHSYCTPVRWEDAQIGDLAFYPDDEHVGIVAGWDKDGNIQIVHCASSYNNVVITGKEGFAAVGHPIYYTND